jgi:hypothetical protein
MNRLHPCRCQIIATSRQPGTVQLGLKIAACACGFVDHFPGSGAPAYCASEGTGLKVCAECFGGDHDRRRATHRASIGQWSRRAADSALDAAQTASSSSRADGVPSAASRICSRISSETPQKRT